MAPLIRDRHRLERSTQVGLARLARIWAPISGKPEIGVCSAPLRTALRPGHASGSTCGCGKRSPAPFPCFRIVIYNGWRNSNVSSGRRVLRRAPLGGGARAPARHVAMTRDEPWVSEEVE